jgi:hypothetical protein
MLWHGPTEPGVEIFLVLVHRLAQGHAKCNSFRESKPSSAKGTLTLTSLHSMSSGYRPMFSTLADQINCQIPTLTSQKSIAHLANPIAKTVMGPTVYVAPHSLSLWLNTTC